MKKILISLILASIMTAVALPSNDGSTFWSANCRQVKKDLDELNGDILEYYIVHNYPDQELANQELANQELANLVHNYPGQELANQELANLVRVKTIFKREIPLDPWGSPYVYIYPEDSRSLSWSLYSIGSNKVDEYRAGDDITLSPYDCGSESVIFEMFLLYLFMFFVIYYLIISASLLILQFLTSS